MLPHVTCSCICQLILSWRQSPWHEYSLAQCVLPVCILWWLEIRYLRKFGSTPWTSTSERSTRKGNSSHKTCFISIVSLVGNDLKWNPTKICCLNCTDNSICGTCRLVGPHIEGSQGAPTAGIPTTFTQKTVIINDDDDDNNEILQCHWYWLPGVWW